LLDACSHISVAFGERPSSYRDIVKAVLKHNIIDKSLGESFEELASFRNVLAHWYNSLDEEFIYNNLTDNHTDLNEIASAIQTFLDGLES
jgi:uncharacterized protein YutE (UPF0331/DUF86 family)